MKIIIIVSSVLTFMVCTYGIALAKEMTLLQPGTRDDYGSGSSYHTEWYFPGGLGDVGYFVGHPNGLPRSDRGLVRFNLSSYLLRPVDTVLLKTAQLHFSITWVTGKEQVRVLEVSHLNYDALSFSGNDLVNADAKMVGTVTIRSGQAAVKEFSINVLLFIKEDIYKGNKYAAFRFRDVTAEQKGNPDLAAAGVVFSAPPSKTLTLIIEEK